MAMYYPLVTLSILPVFAGMIRIRPQRLNWESHSPRIRGDDPLPPSGFRFTVTFSPYSRG